MHKFPIIFYSFVFLIVTASKIRILDDDECKRIPNCDECDDDRCTECDDGFYLTSSFSCERCSQLNCESCPNNVCVKCHDHNILIGSLGSFFISSCFFSFSLCAMNISSFISNTSSISSSFISFALFSLSMLLI